jgi:uncharacterized membrane protein YdbT with pleckstrin-like domain
MSYVDDHLLANERVVYRARLHWIVYLRSVLMLLVAVGITVFVERRWGMEPALIAGGVPFVIGAAEMFSRWLTVWSCEFAVTDKRLIIKTGIIRRHALELLLRQIEGIGVDQGIAGRLFGYGGLTVIGTGGTQERFFNITNPLELRRQVQGQSVL